MTKITRRPWTGMERTFLIENYLLLSDKEIGKRFGRTETAIDSYRGKLGLKKTNDTKFKKGATSSSDPSQHQAKELQSY